MESSVEQARIRFCKYMAINEILFGQEDERMKGFLTELSLSFPLDFGNLYICLTGLKKDFYMTRLGKKRGEYLLLFNELFDEMGTYLEAEGFSYEVAPVQYNHSKQICFLFTPIRENCPPGAVVAEVIHTMLQRHYMEKWKLAAPVCNLTMISDHISSYEQIAGQFEEMRRFSDLRFFISEDAILQRENVKARTIEFPLWALHQEMEALGDAMEQGKLDEVERILEELFLSKLKHSLDFGRCHDVMDEIRRMLLRYSDIFDLDLEGDLRERLPFKKFFFLEEWFAAVRGLFRKVMGKLGETGMHCSYISLEAIRFMKKHYRENISLNQIAKYVNVVPAYLSRVFNRELGVSIPTYLLRIRLNKACALLEQSDMKISEIGSAVGIDNVQYFGVLWKKHMGTAPAEYRERAKKIKRLPENKN